MNLPPDSANDRRTVPRHLRDSEHGMSADNSGLYARRTDGASGPGRVVIWSGIALGAVAAALWWWLT
jgi:hypothetical protein